jgi:hypothetical protein
MTCQSLLYGLAVGLIAFLVGHSVALGSESSGAEIVIGKFVIEFVYTDTIEYPDQLDIYTRDPRYALFEVLRLVQANLDRAARSDATIDIELEGGLPGKGSEVVISETARGREELKTFDARSDYVQSALAMVTAFLGDGWVPSNSETITIYPCIGPKCDGAIAFGALPLPPEEYSGFAIKCNSNCRDSVVVTREEMPKYFDTLPSLETAIKSAPPFAPRLRHFPLPTQ